MSKLSVEDVIQGIRLKPLNPELWRAFQQAFLAKKDEKRAQTADLIAQGVEQIDQAKAQGQLLSGLQKNIFVKLAETCTNLSLLKEVGLLYLHELHWPKLAKKHFEHAKYLGSFDPELSQLIVEAEQAVQKAKQTLSAEESVDKARHIKPKVASLIRKTGKVALNTEQFSGIQWKSPQADEEDTSQVAANEISKNFEEALEGMNRIAREGLPKKAMAIAEIICRREKDVAQHSILWGHLGESFFYTGNFKDAERAYRIAKETDPQDVSSWFNLGLALHLQDKYEEALESYTMAQQIVPDHPKVWCNLGALYFQQDRFVESEAALSQAVKIKPDYARAWDNLAASLGAQDRLKEAAAACIRAIEIQEDFSEPWLKLGMICFSNEQYQEAEEAFHHAKDLAITSAYALHYLAMIHAKKDDAERAKMYVLGAESIDSSCELAWMSWNEIGLTYRSQGKLEVAIEAYKQSLQLHPEAPDVLFNLALAYMEIGDWKKAEVALKKLTEEDSKCFDGWYHLGRLFQLQGSYSQSLPYFLRATKLRPKKMECWKSLLAAAEAANETKIAAKAQESIEALKQ